jgi:high-affinity Fe2+/Pb2+ permease
MKYAVEMVSGAMMYILNFIKTGSGIQKLMEGGIHRHTNTETAW